MEGSVMTEEKARLVKTARFTDAAHAMEPNLPFDPVRVKYMGAMFNAFYNVEEPVFATFTTMADDSFVGTYFARALTDYVL